jgi:hypothetical protein
MKIRTFLSEIILRHSGVFSDLYFAPIARYGEDGAYFTTTRRCISPPIALNSPRLGFGRHERAAVKVSCYYLS